MKKSTSGTQHTPCKIYNSSLTCDEVGKILGLCRKNGVSKIRFRDLSVHFGEGVTLGQRSKKVGKKETQAEAILEQEALAREEVAAKEQLVADLLIQDPLELEKLVERGELDGTRISQSDRTNDDSFVVDEQRV